VLVVFAVAVRVFVDGDLVRPAKMVRRRQRNLVINTAEEFVLANHFQAGRIWILQIVHNPQTTSRIPFHRERLTNVRLREDEIDGEVFGCLETSERIGRGKWAIVSRKLF
jgi:hypothetical protein